MDRRSLPSVDQFVAALGPWPLPRTVITDVARSVLERARSGMLNGSSDLEAEAMTHLSILARTRPRSLLNATGVILHTNLGRALMAEEAAQAAHNAAVSYTNLELDSETGNRGRRGSYLLRLLADLTGAEAALVVNNNAGALVLTLAAVAAGREVIVSRGELIEIGGAYRLPEIIAAGGASLVEVGTTNRTRVTDYRSAVTEATAALLKVHTSNYRIVGFTEQASLADLVGLGRESGSATVLDAGSGLLDDRVPWLGGPPPTWLAEEPGVRQAIDDGADLVLFSGDKLFGGPQAGVVVGRSELIGRLTKHPLARALRVDGSTIAAMTVTADMYADGRGAHIPIWRMASATYTDLEARAQLVLAEAEITGAVVEQSFSVIGAGSAPGASLPSPVIAIESKVDEVFRSLLIGDPPVLARREAGRLILDLRTVPEEADPSLGRALAVACRS